MEKILIIEDEESILMALTDDLALEVQIGVTIDIDPGGALDLELDPLERAALDVDVDLAGLQGHIGGFAGVGPVAVQGQLAA